MIATGRTVKQDGSWIPFCEKHGIKPFKIDEEDIDLESHLIETLMDAFRNNVYDRNVPIVIARSDDPDIDKEVIDGRHRIIAVYRLFKKDIQVKFPAKVEEEVTDMHMLDSKIADAVQRSRSKEPALAKRIVKRRMTRVIEAKIDKYGDRLPDHLLKLGFGYVSIANELMDEVKEKRRQQKKRPGQKQLHASNPALQYDFGGSENWGVSRYANESIQAGPQDKMDEVTAFRPCPCGCKPPKRLAIINGLDGSLRDIKLAAEEEAMSK